MKQKCLRFLAATLQMEHTIPGRLKDSWTKLEQVCLLFYGRTVVRSRYHKHRFLHFTGNSRNGVDRTYDSIDRLRRTRGLLEILQTDVSKFYSPSEHLKVEIMKCKGSVIFKQCIPPKAYVSASEWRGNVACVQRGAWSEKWDKNASSVTLPRAWIEAASRITTQRTTSRTSFHPSSAQQLKPFPKAIYFTYPFRLVLEIFTIFKKHAPKLNTLADKFCELELHLGFTTVFKALSHAFINVYWGRIYTGCAPHT
jgi:hypothetical protein